MSEMAYIIKVKERNKEREREINLNSPGHSAKTSEQVLQLEQYENTLEGISKISYEALLSIGPMAGS